MKVSWQWVALGAVYIGLAWSATTIISTAFLLNVRPYGLGLIPLLLVLMILVLSLVGIYDIKNRFSKVFGSGPVRYGGARLKEPALWAAYAIILIGLAWGAANTAVGMVLVGVLYSSLFFGLVFLLFIQLALTWCLIGVPAARARRAFRWRH